MLFLGNIIVSGWWKAVADRTRDPRIVAFAQRQITFTDCVFTFGGVLLVLATGLANARLLALRLCRESLAGKLARLASSFVNGGTIPQEYWRLSRYWHLWSRVLHGVQGHILTEEFPRWRLRSLHRGPRRAGYNAARRPQYQTNRENT